MVSPLRATRPTHRVEVQAKSCRFPPRISAAAESRAYASSNEARPAAAGPGLMLWTRKGKSVGKEGFHLRVTRVVSTWGRWTRVAGLFGWMVPRRLTLRVSGLRAPGLVEEE